MQQATGYFLQVPQPGCGDQHMKTHLEQQPPGRHQFPIQWHPWLAIKQHGVSRMEVMPQGWVAEVLTPQKTHGLVAQLMFQMRRADTVHAVTGMACTQAPFDIDKVDEKIL